MVNELRWLVTPCMHRLSPLMGEWVDVHMAPFGKSLGSSYQVSAELWPMHTFPTPDFYLYCWAKLKDNRNITAFVNYVASSRGLSELEMFLRTPSGLNVYHTWMVLLLTKAETRNRRRGRARPSKICGIFLLWRKLFQVPLMRTWLCLVLADLLLDLFTLKNGDQFSGSKKSRDIDDLAWSLSEELCHKELTESKSLDAELSSPGSCTPHQRWSWIYVFMIHIVQAGTSWLTRSLRWSSWAHLSLACFCPQLSLTCWTYLSCTWEGMSQEWPSINEVPWTALTERNLSG